MVMTHLSPALLLSRLPPCGVQEISLLVRSHRGHHRHKAGTRHRETRTIDGDRMTVMLVTMVVINWGAVILIVINVQQREIYTRQLEAEGKTTWGSEKLFNEHDDQWSQVQKLEF